MSSNPSSESLKHALQVLKESGVDPSTLSKHDIYAFATRSPEAQQRALNQLLQQLSLGGNDSEDSDDDHQDDASDTIEDLLTRCRSLVEELEEFARYLQEKRKGNLVEYRTFRNELKSEVRFLEKLQASDLDRDKIQHNISSSNLPYYEALWAAAKRSSEILTFRKWFYWDKIMAPSGPAPMPKHEKEALKSNKPKVAPNKARKQHSALVDCVARNGLEWIKVSTITENRILMELAKQGWQNDSDSDEDMEDDDMSNDKGPLAAIDDDTEVSLLKIAHDLTRAARTNRIRTHLPHITFVLPRIHRRAYTQVDRILAQLAATGASVLCADEIPPTPPLADALPSLMVDFTRGFTSTVNIDCTILLALISDISHHDVPPQPWYPRAVRQQIESERRDKLLPGTLYPVMEDRELVCTADAAQRMSEIVGTIGTETEKERARIFLEEDPNVVPDSKNLLSRLDELTTHHIPPTLRLPIRVLPPFNLDETLSLLPSVAVSVSKQLTPINQSIFLTAWANKITTLSSNATVAKQIERVIEEERGPDEETIGPHIWLCEQSRSLVSKAGRGDGRWGDVETRTLVKEVIR